MFQALEVSSSALGAYRTRMNIIANNVSNMRTTRDADGNSIPYRRRIALFQAGADGLEKEQGVSIKDIVLDNSPLTKRYEPGHPDAVKSGPDAGYVYYPNVNPEIEMVDLIIATRAYQANITVFEASKSLIGASLRLIA